ncbi:nitrate reductase molybdenum cofactor assembly chaperone, partial [sediment metagenome]
AVVAAVLELAGQKAQAVPIEAEESMDESWAEPMAFDGCSTKGQARPGDPQPIHIVRKTVQQSADRPATPQGVTA